MTDEQEQIALAIVRAVDQIRLDSQGGYYSDCLVNHNTLYWADVDHKGAPALHIYTFNALVEEYAWLWEDFEDLTMAEWAKTIP